MPERRRRSNASARALIGLLAVLALLAAGASGAVAGQDASEVTRQSIFVAAPGDDPCDSYTPAPGVTEDPCDRGGGGGVAGGVNLLIVGAGVIVAGGILALVVTYLVLRRRASGPFVPADPTEWWTCGNCGKSNVVGSPRCYACASWQA